MSDLKQVYDDLYAGDSDYHGGYHSDGGVVRFQKILKILRRNLPEKDFSAWRVLDIGCSTGELMEFLKPYFRELAGVDIADKAVELARAKGFSEVFVSDVEHGRLPFADHSFNLAFSLEIVEHLFSGRNLLAEAQRVLSPGGYLFVSVPNDVLNWRRRLRIMFGQIPFQDKVLLQGNHLRFFSTASLRAILEHTGFEVLECGGYPLSYHGVSLGLPGEWLSRFWPDLCASGYFALARTPQHGKNPA